MIAPIVPGGNYEDSKATSVNSFPRGSQRLEKLARIAIASLMLSWPDPSPTSHNSTFNDAQNRKPPVVSADRFPRMEAEGLIEQTRFTVEEVRMEYFDEYGYYLGQFQSPAILVQLPEDLSRHNVQLKAELRELLSENEEGSPNTRLLSEFTLSDLNEDPATTVKGALQKQRVHTFAITTRNEQAVDTRGTLIIPITRWRSDEDKPYLSDDYETEDLLLNLNDPGRPSSQEFVNLQVVFSDPTNPQNMVALGQSINFTQSLIDPYGRTMAGPFEITSSGEYIFY